MTRHKHAPLIGALALLAAGSAVQADEATAGRCLDAQGNPITGSVGTSTTGNGLSSSVTAGGGVVSGQTSAGGTTVTTGNGQTVTTTRNGSGVTVHSSGNGSSSAASSSSSGSNGSVSAGTGTGDCVTVTR